MNQFPWVALGIIVVTVVMVSPTDKYLNSIWNSLVDGMYWLGEKFEHVTRRVWKWQREYRKYGKQGHRHAPRNVHKLTWVGADDSWADTLRDIPKVRVH